MSEANVILINPQKYYRDVFTTDSVYLYLPKDDEGNIVNAGQAKYLECWANKEVYNPDLPAVFTSSQSGIGHALLWKEGDHELGTLSVSIMFSSLKKMDHWLHYLQRDPAKDIHYGSVYVK